MEENKIGVIKNNGDKHAIQIGLFFFRLGFVLYLREYWKYKNWFIIPTVTISAINGYDWFFDIELKFLVFGFGFRIIWKKKKN